MHKNPIDGEWDGSDGVENINPSNINEVMGVYARAKVEETNQASAATKVSFLASLRSGILERRAILSETSQEILARKAELGELLNFWEEVLPSVRPGVGVEITREPIGVVGIITPWTFRSHSCLEDGDLVPASTWAIMDTFVRPDLPRGVLNPVMGEGSVVGQTMLDSKDVNALSFTGSVGTGTRPSVLP